MAKILLDENLSPKLRARLSPHEVFTVAYLGLASLHNGDLLDAAEAAGFQIFITADKSLEYQQHLPGRSLAVLSLSANAWPIIQRHVDKILLAIEGARPGTVTRVDCGSFSRTRKLEGPEFG